MVTQIQIEQLVKEIANGYKPEKIYLFGSYANGTANYDSDIDLFIVKDTNVRKKDRHEMVLNSFDFKYYPNVGLDFIIYTPQELENTKDDFFNIAKEAIKTGRLLYEKL